MHSRRYIQHYKQVLFLFPVLIFFLANACAVPANKLESIEREITVLGNERSYRVYFPPTLKDTPTPLMMVLHGGMGFAEETESTTGMNRIANKEGFIVVYPNGTGGKLGPMKKHRTWNAGACCGRAARIKTDDVAFLRKVVDDIASQHPVDKKRVYIAGMSNGAMMAYRMACEAPDLVAAIVPISGTMAIQQCKNANPVAVLHIHGSADSNVPLHGGKGKTSIAGVKHRSVLETINIITQARNCNKSDTHQSGTSKITNYNCGDHAPIVFRLVENGEHVWPGGNSRRNKKLSNGDFSGSQVAWDFVRQFSR